MNITNRQLEVLDFIKRSIAKNGYAPTVREIAAGLNVKSPATIQEHLQSLVLNGVITMDKRKSRTIEVLVQNEYLKGTDETVPLPLIENGYEQVTKEFIPIPYFMLNNYDPKNLCVFKSEDSYYIINTTLNFRAKPALTVRAGIFSIEKKPSSEIYGNIIGEYKFY